MDTFSSVLKYLRKRDGFTQSEFATRIGVSKSAVSMYENGNREPDFTTLEIIADFFNVDMNFLLGKVEQKPSTPPFHDYTDIKNLMPIKTKKFPLIGTITCGKPIMAEQHFESYVSGDANINADFCLRCKGDSMTGARIEDGDIVFVKEQPDVKNGEIAAVIIDDEATLKRINKNTSGFIFLMPENAKYEPIVVNLAEPDESRHIRIIGKAVAFQGDVI